MNLSVKQKGFSLTEVLLAVGTLAIGMTFVSGTFLAGVYLSTVATERTIAAVVADEAFAKVELYGLDPQSTTLSTTEQVPFSLLNPIPLEEFAYPSTKSSADKQYFWSAICRPMYAGNTNRIVQVTVFISRKVGHGLFPGDSEIPVPVSVGVSSVTGVGNENKLIIDNATNQQTFINAGATVVANSTGRLYRVLERDASAQNTISLDQPWQEGTTGSVWVVPPPVGSDRYPCVAVYQKEIRF